VDQLAGPMTGVHQPAQHAQLVDLIDRVEPLAEGITPGVRKAVAALPDSQRVFGQTGVTLDRGNRSRRGLDGAWICHSNRIVLDID
jgi:hypothetical protein